MDKLEFFRRELEELERKAEMVVNDAMYTDEARERFKAVKDAIRSAVVETYFPCVEEIPY